MKQAFLLLGFIIYSIGGMTGALIVIVKMESCDDKSADASPVPNALKPGVYCLHGSPLVPVIVSVSQDGNLTAKLANRLSTVDEKGFVDLLPCPNN